MGSDLVLTLPAFENELIVPLQAQIEDMLGDVMSFARFKRTAIMSAEKNPKLLRCTPQSLIGTITGSAVLGLEMDGVTGQAFPVPFAGVAQLVIGYKGYNTLAGRSGYTITGDVVLEGDNFEFDLGRAFISHTYPLSRPATARVIGAWALMSSNSAPPALVVMPLAELEAVKNAAPAVKHKVQTPWTAGPIGYAAMCSKTAKRRLARVAPLNLIGHRYHWAASMEEQRDELGKLAFVHPDRGVITQDGDLSPIAERRSEQPQVTMLTEQQPDQTIERLKLAGFNAAAKGTKALDAWVAQQNPIELKRIADYGRATLRPTAEEFDRTNDDEF